MPDREVIKKMEGSSGVLDVIEGLPEDQQLRALKGYYRHKEKQTSEEIEKIKTGLQQSRSEMAEEMDQLESKIQENQRETSHKIENLQKDVDGKLRSFEEKMEQKLAANEKITQEIAQKVIESVSSISQQISKNVTEQSVSMARMEVKLENLVALDSSIKELKEGQKELEKELKDGQKELEKRINKIDSNESEGRGQRTISNQLLFSLVTFGSGLFIAAVAALWAIFGKK